MNVKSDGFRDLKSVADTKVYIKLYMTFGPNYWIAALTKTYITLTPFKYDMKLIVPNISISIYF